MLYGHRALMLVQQEVRERNREWEKERSAKLSEQRPLLCLQSVHTCWPLPLPPPPLPGVITLRLIKRRVN